MTLRALFVIFGIATFAPSAGFLALFRPPYGSILKNLKNHQLDERGSWWIGFGLRLLATANALNGFRVMEVNLTNGDKPFLFNGWFDYFTSISTLTLSALATTLFFGVYLAFRQWPSEGN